MIKAKEACTKPIILNAMLRDQRPWNPDYLLDFQHSRCACEESPGFFTAQTPCRVTT